MSGFQITASFELLRGLKGGSKGSFSPFVLPNRWISAQRSQTIANVSILGLFAAFRLPIKSTMVGFFLGGGAGRYFKVLCSSWKSNDMKAKRPRQAGMFVSSQKQTIDLTAPLKKQTKASTWLYTECSFCFAVIRGCLRLKSQEAIFRF